MRGDLCLCTGIKSTFPFGDLYLDATSYAPPFRRYLAGDRAGDLANLLSDESLVPRADNGRALFACFPGGGAKYNCHYDGGAGDPRKLTAILYVNEGWRGADDGRLMMYDAGSFSVQHGPGEPCWRSVQPIAGRLVLFRSEMVLHKVNPSYARRFALTMFYAAKTQKELKRDEREQAAEGLQGGEGLGVLSFA